MYTLKLLFIYIFLLLSSRELLAKSYESAEDKKIKRWQTLQEFSKGTVSNIYDKKKKSRVIKLDGNSTRSAYQLRDKKSALWKNKTERILHWEMNFSEDFLILISLNTEKGKRFLIYTPGDDDSYMQYGLGLNATLGIWKSYYRNLQEDLERFEINNRIIWVNGFMIRGSGLLDNIKLTKAKKNLKKEKKITESLAIKKIIPKESTQKETPSKISTKKRKSHTPIIYINGDNPMVLKKGEKYKELGAIAKDKNNKELVVNSSHAIDIFMEGEYTVLYMATDAEGNSVIDKRRVRVGKFSEEKESISKESEEEVEIEDLESREMEMAAWEKELLLREKEIAFKENKGTLPSQPSNQPLRPGL
jgi:hypothetical protein